MDYREFEEKLGHHFHNKKYLITALTHSSYANEAKGKEESNERLEFLGDSVLGFVVADYLFKNYTQFPEGDLTKTALPWCAKRHAAALRSRSTWGIICG